jgi:hypothetical protein
MEPESPSPYSQVPATCPYLEPTPSNPQDYFMPYLVLYVPCINQIYKSKGKGHPITGHEGPEVE